MHTFSSSLGFIKGNLSGFMHAHSYKFEYFLAYTSVCFVCMCTFGIDSTHSVINEAPAL